MYTHTFTLKLLYNGVCYPCVQNSTDNIQVLRLVLMDGNTNTRYTAGSDYRGLGDWLMVDRALPSCPESSRTLSAQYSLLCCNWIESWKNGFGNYKNWDNKIASKCFLNASKKFNKVENTSMVLSKLALSFVLLTKILLE